MLLALSAALALPALAQESAQGRKIAMEGAGSAVPACATCHGANGEGSGAFPHLAGTGQAYLQAQLGAFANGSRKNAVMQPIAKALSDAQRSAVAQHYSSLAAQQKGVDPAQLAPAQAGAWLATRGRWADQVPACAQCHGPGGNGVGTSFPPLAGLPAAYITEQLQAWKDGTRPPGPQGLMQTVAQKLTSADIQAISAYYAGNVAVASVDKSKPANIQEGK
ncbi:MAG: c-type cytochrome [Burkholderiaceae bacterium]